MFPEQPGDQEINPAASTSTASTRGRAYGPPGPHQRGMYRSRWGLVASLTRQASSQGSSPPSLQTLQKHVLWQPLAAPGEVLGCPPVGGGDPPDTLVVSSPIRQRMASTWHWNDSSPLLSYWARLAALGACAAGESRSRKQGDGSGSGFDPRPLSGAVSFASRTYRMPALWLGGFKFCARELACRVVRRVLCV